MIEANVFVANATLAEVADIITGILLEIGLDDYAVLTSENKAGGVEMVVQFNTMLQYDEFIYELDMIMQSSVTTFIY